MSSLDSGRVLSVVSMDVAREARGFSPFDFQN